MICSKEWRENRRAYKIERHANEARRFILCSFCDEEVERFDSIFLEGKGLLSGWPTLANYLRSLKSECFAGSCEATKFCEGGVVGS